MSGQWPPEWEDSDTGLPDEWSIDEAGPDPETSEVTLFLASVPSPVLPASFEARISAAIAAEVAARANGTTPAGTESAHTASAGTESAHTAPAGTESAHTASAGTESAHTASAGTESAHTAPAGTESAHTASADIESAGTESAGTESAGIEPAGIEPAGAGIATAGSGDAKTTGRSSPPEFAPAAAEGGAATAARHRRRRTSAASGSASRRSGPTGSRPGGRRRRFRMPSPAVTAPLLVLLFIAGFALVLSQFGSLSSSSSSSSESANGTAAPAASAAAAAPTGAHPPSNGFYDGSGPQYETNLSGNGGEFVVTESHTSYQGSTLAGQVREELRAQSPVTPAPTPPSPAATSPSTAVPFSASIPASIAPSTALRGCVSRLTGGVTPRLVDRASYDGTPAYIIAIPSRVWVVRLGCTATDPQEITSVSLTG